MRKSILLVALWACASPAKPTAGVDAKSDGGADAAGELAMTLSAKDYRPFVDPRIGTGGSGNVFYGATWPHGAIKLGPDTDNGKGGIRGYLAGAKKIQGFSHTHLDGPGGSAYGYGQIALLPTLDTTTVDEAAYALPFAATSEVAHFDRYAVTLLSNGAPIGVQLAATQRCGVHEYAFAAGTARVLVNFGHTRGESRGGQIAVSGGQVTGRADYSVHPLLTGALEFSQPPSGLASVFADIQFSPPPASAGLFKSATLTDKTADEGPELGAWLQWQLAAPQTIRASVCLSWVDAATAKQAQTETANLPLETVATKAEFQWAKLLGRVRVQSDDQAALTRFYTALYHALLQPADYTENGQFWNGNVDPPAVQSASGRRYYTDDWCTWDTARTTHPLLLLVAPEVVGDMLQSMLWQAGPKGYLPKCTWQASGDSRVMTGNFPFALFADALAKGASNFDQQAGFDAMVRGAMTDCVTPYDSGLCGYFNQGTPPFYVSKGWVPSECDGGQGASMTLEYAYADWALGQYAKKFGKPEMAAQMQARAGNWRNTFNPQSGFPQLRASDGSFKGTGDPTSAMGFTEANAWIYQWFVPHDVCGLMAQMGGKDVFRQRLDSFFADGHFDMGNEPDFHAPWLYHYLGRPDLSSAQVRQQMAKHFGNGADGLPGNDDAGAMSAWYVLAALGLYSLAPGDDRYALSAPLFEKIELQVGGKVVRIEAAGAPAKTAILSATWNGAPLTVPFIAHADLAKGGVLALQLGDGPSDWGAAASCK